MTSSLSPRTIVPIGVIRSPFRDKVSAPRQSSLAEEVRGVVELVPNQGLEDAITGLDAFDHIWLLFLFHEANGHWKPKVQPPRSQGKRGVLATRSPHRPNGIGMSVVRLERVEGLRLFVLGIDMVDGTPVVDVKPYIPYADAIVNASSGWLDGPADPGPRHRVTWSEPAREQLEWLRREHGVDVEGVETVLSAGAEPHAYRRIRKLPDGRSRIAVRSWRFDFAISGGVVCIDRIHSGYRPAQLHGEAKPRCVGGGEDLSVHRAFVERFGDHGAG